MSLLLDVPLGVQRPTILLEPAGVVSHAAAVEAVELADAYGVADGFPLDSSQRFTLRVGLGERADGSWAASTVADFEPRQNGKNDSCAARELAGLILFGERLLIHTAHEFPTANESFLRLVAVFENWDDLRRRVARIRYANGEQGIELLTGQRLKYRARTGGSGRGFAKADLLVYDEAQHLRPEHVAASGPSRLANPNSQSWYMGSGGFSTSVNAWRLRRRALAGERGRLAYVEHTAEDVHLVGDQVVSRTPDVLSREAWAQANPAYGARIFDESLLGLLDEMGSELFARECLCIWEDDHPGGGVFDPGLWAALADGDSEVPGQPYFALDVTPDRSSASVLVAGVRADGLVHGAVVEHRQGTGWVVESVKDLPGRLIVGVGSPAMGLVKDLEESGKTVDLVSQAEYVAGCGAFYDLVVQSRLRYRPSSHLDAAVGAAQQKPAGDAWRWSRKGFVDISPLVGLTLACWRAAQPREFFGGFG